METKISKDVLKNSGVAEYVRDEVPWVQYIDKLPEDPTELLAKTPVGGLIIVNQPSTTVGGSGYVRYIDSLPTDPDEFAALEASIPDGGLLIVENED